MTEGRFRVEVRGSSGKSSRKQGSSLSAEEQRGEMKQIASLHLRQRRQFHGVWLKGEVVDRDVGKAEVKMPETGAGTRERIDYNFRGSAGSIDWRIDGSKEVA
jgi:hypothetical protein